MALNEVGDETLLSLEDVVIVKYGDRVYERDICGTLRSDIVTRSVPFLGCGSCLKDFKVLYTLLELILILL